MQKPRRIVYSPLLLGVLFGGLPTLIIYATKVKPYERHFFIFDARLSNPYKSNTISSAVALIVSIVVSIGEIILAEYIFVRNRLERWTRIIQAAINVFTAFMYQIAIQQISAVMVGKQRPNFIEECDPDPVAYTLGAIRSDVSVASYSLTNAVCRSSDITDSLKSFPSGHTSSTTILTLFGMFYFLHAYYFLRTIKHNERHELTWFARAKGDLKDGLVGALLFAQFLWIWGVGMSRFVDNKHHVEDIVAGWFLGTVFAVWAAWTTFAMDYRLEASRAALLHAPLAHPASHANAADGAGGVLTAAHDGKAALDGKAAHGAGAGHSEVVDPSRPGGVPLEGFQALQPTDE